MSLASDSKASKQHRGAACPGTRSAEGAGLSHGERGPSWTPAGQAPRLPWSGGLWLHPHPCPRWLLLPSRSSRVEPVSTQVARTSFATAAPASGSQRPGVVRSKAGAHGVGPSEPAPIRGSAGLACFTAMGLTWGSGAAGRTEKHPGGRGPTASAPRGSRTSL